MGNGGDVSGDSVKDEQGYLWLCGLCEEKPTFVTVYDLFAHKKVHRAQSEEESNNCLPKGNHEKGIIGDFSERHSYDRQNSSPIELQEHSLSNFSDDKEITVDIIDDENDNKPLSILKEEVMPSGSVNSDISNDTSPWNSTRLNNEMTDAADIAKSEISDGGNEKIWSDESNNSDNQKTNVETINEPKKQVKHICKICKEEFDSRFRLSKHKPVHISPEIGMYKCSTCGKFCPKYDNFIRHLTIHQENRTKPFSCDLCSTSFYNMADLKRHAILHSEVKPFNCGHCNEGFTRQDALLIHMGKHTGVPYSKFTCKLCNKVLNSPSALAMHSKNHTEKSVFCPEADCNFSCYLRSQLRQHLRCHSGEKPFQCAICGRCFARSNDMKNHILNVHEKVRPHKCPECPKQFTLRSSLKSHKLIHMNTRPYLCSECGKRFNHPSTLRKHTTFLHRHLCDPCSDVKEEPAQNRDEQQQEEKQDTVAKDSATYSNIIVQQQIPMVTIPIHIPQITVNIDPSYAQTYIIPAITINTTPQIFKPEDT